MEPDNWNNAVKLNQLYFLDYKLVIDSSSLHEQASCYWNYSL